MKRVCAAARGKCDETQFILDGPRDHSAFGVALLSVCSTSTTAGLERDDPHWYVRELDAAGRASWRDTGQVEPPQASVG